MYGLHRSHFPARLDGHFPHLVGTPGNDIHIRTQVLGDAPVLVTPHIGKLTDTLLLDGGGLTWCRRRLCMLPVIAGLVYHTLHALLYLVRAFCDDTLDILYALVYIILVRLPLSSIGTLLPFVAHMFPLCIFIMSCLYAMTSQFCSLLCIRSIDRRVVSRASTAGHHKGCPYRTSGGSCRGILYDARLLLTPAPRSLPAPERP